MLCLNDFVAAGCVLLISGANGVIENLKNKVADWVASKFGDASTAGPHTQRDELDSASVTWGDLYAYHASHGSLKWDPIHQVSSLVAIANTAVAEPVAQITDIELHEDGFSFSNFFNNPKNCPISFYVVYHNMTT
ncbi:hypothetical protein G7054_g5460 [Neopestalotiopsis clavispora]|nr:hypothetical protein E8E14_001169 [Neopestalotiopsis sp. 37M]KAF7535366.1 hypothetical protein G7054_g5460 [Neopestalotiopsis clavispora]